MIAFDTFMQLKAGDIVIFNGRPRTIMEGPADMPTGSKRRSHGSLSFPIKHRSWTNRAYTTYGFHDLKQKIRLPRKVMNIAEICKAETDLLRAHRFDPIRELEREILEAERLERITGRATRAIRVAKAKLKRLMRRKQPTVKK